MYNKNEPILYFIKYSFLCAFALTCIKIRYISIADMKCKFYYHCNINVFLNNTRIPKAKQRVSYMKQI